MSSEAAPAEAAEQQTGPAATSEQKVVSPGKKGRHRKKHKYNAIRQQMEFYFSDANLAKDRYLSQCIKEDPFIALEEFLKFNRIKTLTDSVEDIAVALKNSELLELSEDRTKVHRVTEFRERVNCEDCTIYVESLPPKADHEWVRNVFSAYGKVVYVSLPTFKYSKKIKEFGFVEFEEETSVQKAIKTFQAFGGVLTFEDTEPEKLLSISSFGKEKEEEAKKEKEEAIAKPDDGKPAEEQDAKEESVEPPAKRVKKCEDDTSDGEPTKDSGNEESHSEVEGDKKDGEEGDKKKRRRRRGPSGVKKEIQQDDKVYELKIMSKKEWRRLRNKYLNLQRVEAKKLKKLFATSNNKVANKVQQSRTPNQTAGSKTVKSSPRVNFYGALTDEEAAAEVTKFEEHDQQNKQPLFSFEPGLIVNIRFRVPCANVKDFKAELKQFPYVKYIDLKEGDSQAFVRVDKPCSANALVKEYSMAEYSAQILSGETEKSYWDKIKGDREDKLNKKVKVEKVRGRSKLMKKVNTHIKFDDE
ncbi:la-related protein 7 [Culex pipiens pallens]|uniref:la-related protein 7 n=1 Tax=Culex pipiens pallens TaxID=42434 RepID=UPI0019541454|nr:la-related protein 7 [Culex pipiens pallens]XP_052563754.1 la-related protein 7 [Culex pipiens pallens]